MQILTFNLVKMKLCKILKYIVISFSGCVRNFINTLTLINAVQLFDKITKLKTLNIKLTSFK